MSDLHHLSLCVTSLVNGFRERVDYKVRITLHVQGCGMILPQVCMCPEVVEDRSKNMRHEALLSQLQRQAHMPKSGIGGGGSCGNKPKSRPPGNQEPSDLIDSIKEQAWERYDTLCRQTRGTVPMHLSRTSVTQVLHNLLQVAQLADRDDYRLAVSDAAHAAGGWVRSARIMLGYDKPTVMLADMVCGECSGALVVAVDASTDVRCAGSPGTPSCGRVYPRWQWPDLLGDA